MASEWISTGKAAAMLGYSRDQFRKKFKHLIPNRRFEGGHIQWLAEAVERMAGSMSDMSQAG